MNTILVSSHRRSGTHFLIDSLRKNIPGADFPNHAFLPADFNIGSLFSKSEHVYRIFQRQLDRNGPIIVKSHLLPEECNPTRPRDKFESLIKSIFNESRKLYISRDGRDVLISLFKFLKPRSTFSEFIREPNDHIVHEIRTPQPYDDNRVAYWSYHVDQWKQVDGIMHLSFGELKQDFQTTLSSVLGFLEIPHVDSIEIPQLPKNLVWHRILKKLNHYGLTELPESSSVQPGNISRTASGQYFSPRDEAFYARHIDVSA